MKNSINALHYCIYITFCSIRQCSKKINPFVYLFRLPPFKRRQRKLGIDIEQVVDRVFADPRFGFIIVYADVGIVGVLFLLLMSAVLLLHKLSFIEQALQPVHFYVVGLVSYVICYFLVFKNDESLRYFSRFQNWPRRKQVMYQLFSMMFIIFVVVLFFLSL